MFKECSDSFKPYYKWNTFNTTVEGDLTKMITEF